MNRTTGKSLALIKWCVLSGLILLSLMTVLRIVFFIHFHTAGYSFNNCLQAFLLGLRFDIRTACCIVLPLLLVGSMDVKRTASNRWSGASVVKVLLAAILMLFMILFFRNNKVPAGLIGGMGVLFLLIFYWLFRSKNCSPYSGNVSRKIWEGYFLVITILLLFFYVVDFQHFDYLHQRLNASVLNYTEDAGISFVMVWQTYPVVRLLLLIVGGVILAYWLIRKSYKISANSTSKAPRIAWGVLFLLLVFGIFGRFGQYPLRWSDAYSFGDDFKANLALNPVQSFFSTLRYRRSNYDERKVRSYYPFMASYLGIDNPDSNRLVYSRAYKPASRSANRPNLVVVICESFSAYKSSMWGNPLNTTPYFSKMCNEGIFFDHCFTPSYGTARGVWAVLTGIPDVETPVTASRNPAAVDQHVLLNDLAGYEKFYFLGGSTSWANIRGLLTNNIADLHLYEEGSYKAKAIDVWGISDKQLFLEANSTLGKQQQPFAAVIQTADNHRPYTIPAEDRGAFKSIELPGDSLHKYGFMSNEELNAFRYTDFCFQSFMEAARKESYFSNTVFVFVGDHGIKGDAGSSFPRWWTDFSITQEHVPLLFYSPSLVKPARVSRVCSQVDVLPSALALINAPYTNTALGLNIFDTTHFGINRAAFLFDPDLSNIGAINNNACYIHSLVNRTARVGGYDNKFENVIDSTGGKPLAQFANAFYETARYLLLHNKKRINVKP